MVATHTTTASTNKVLLISKPANIGFIRIQSMFCNNDSTGTIHVKLYDAAAANDVTIGTSVPKDDFAVPVGGVILPDLKSLEFGLGVVITITAGYGAADATATAANIAKLRVEYQNY
jgi:hypothetical protein